MPSRNDRFKLIPAVYLILRDSDKVLLLQRANTGYQDGKYSVPAGHLDGGELATAALAREAQEEAGIIIDPTDLTFAHIVHRLNRNELGQERVDLFFTAERWQGQVTNMEPDKCSDLAWFASDNLPPNMVPLVRQVLTDVAHGVIYSEYTDEPT